jgi:Cu/Ag efflux pump CusA
VLLAGAGVIYTQVGKTFMPTMDEGDILIGIEKQPTVSLSQTLELDSRDPAGADEVRPGNHRHRGAGGFRRNRP